MTQILVHFFAGGSYNIRQGVCSVFIQHCVYALRTNLGMAVSFGSLSKVKKKWSRTTVVVVFTLPPKKKTSLPFLKQISKRLPCNTGKCCQMSTMVTCVLKGNMWHAIKFYIKFYLSSPVPVRGQNPSILSGSSRTYPNADSKMVSDPVPCKPVV